MERHTAAAAAGGGAAAEAQEEAAAAVPELLEQAEPPEPPTGAVARAPHMPRELVLPAAPESSSLPFQILSRRPI